MKRNGILIFISIILISCNDSSKDAADGALAEEYGLKELRAENPKNEEVRPEQMEDAIQSQKIIKDGNMGIEVDDVQQTKKEVDKLVHQLQAYYANERLSNTDNATVYRLEIRVPAQNFEELIAAIESGNYGIQYKNVSARDVTEEFIDLETRLENKRNYLKQYNALLKKANTINEILEIEERIRNIEEEIESVEGRLNYLSNQVAFSTLNLEIIQREVFQFQPKKHENFGAKLTQSLSNGWYAFISFLLFVVKLWPFWLLVVLILWFLKSKKKKLRTKN